ncbi:hypothetical protein TRVL_06619 [Trypanosoma vivax]|nr:hypothetical protein TRVL_06619 [Trypanosoma vivax]
MSAHEEDIVTTPIGISKTTKACVWKHLLFGCANVSIKIALRCEEVSRAAINLEHRAREAQKSTADALKEYKHLLSVLEKSPNQIGFWSRVSQLIANVISAITQSQASESKAKQTEKKAKESIITATDSFLYILLAGLIR